MLLRQLPQYLVWMLVFVCLGFSVGASAAELGLELYGRLNIAYDWNDRIEDDWMNYVSRIGLKGGYEINDGLRIVYQLEQGFDPVHGGTSLETLFSTRDSFIGLEGAFGTVLFGAYNTPFKRAQLKIDRFNDQSGDIRSLFTGEVRATDSLFYHSPRLKGWQFTGAYVPNDSSFDSSQSFAVNYKSDNWRLAFAADHDMRKNNRSVSRTRVYDGYRGSVQYNTGNLQLGLILQMSEQQNTVDADWESAYVTSLSYKISDITILAQYGESDITGDDVSSANVGISYHWEKNAKVYLHYWQLDRTVNSERVSLGIEYKF